MPKYKSHRITVNIPEALMPLLHERMKEEHYHSESAFFCGLFLEDLLTRTPHHFAPQILSDPKEVLDGIVIEIIRESVERKKQEKARSDEGGGNR